MVHTIPRKLNARIEALVASGKYKDVDSLMEESISLLERRDASEAKLRALIKEGEDAFDRGEWVEYTDDFFDRLGREAEARALEGLPIRDEVKP